MAPDKAEEHTEMVVTNFFAKYNKVRPHAARLTPHASRLAPHAFRPTPHANPTPRASRLTPHASRLAPHASRLAPHASRLTPHAPRPTPHASRRTPHASRLTPKLTTPHPRPKPLAPRRAPRTRATGLCGVTALVPDFTTTGCGRPRGTYAHAYLCQAPTVFTLTTGVRTSPCCEATISPSLASGPLPPLVQYAHSHRCSETRGGRESGGGAQPRTAMHRRTTTCRHQGVADERRTAHTYRSQARARERRRQGRHGSGGGRAYAAATA